MGAELSDDRAEDPGGRTRISAPVPRARRADSCSVPLLTPTNVRIIVTSTAMATTLRIVRTGLWARLAKMSLLSKTTSYSEPDPRMCPDQSDPSPDVSSYRLPTVNFTSARAH